MFTPSQLHDAFLICQAVSMPALVRVLFLAVSTRPNLLSAVKIISLAYSFWDLDIIQTIIPNICLPISPVQSLALDYTIAVYPLLLNFVMYHLIELYVRNIRCIEYLWKPFLAHI